MNTTDIDAFLFPGEKLFHALTFVNGVTCLFTIVCKFIYVILFIIQWHIEDCLGFGNPLYKGLLHKQFGRHYGCS